MEPSSLLYVSVLLIRFARGTMTADSSLGVQPVMQHPWICEREGAKRLGQKPVRIDGTIRGPRKLRDVHPSYPKLPPGTVGTGNWIGEVLIDTRGKVRGVWVIRAPKLTPPYPPFAKAIVDAIRQWEFEPLKVRGVPKPVCVTVMTTVDWK
jgi:hypothetical protein